VLAGRVGAVMAADAVTRDVHVIEVRRYPGDRRVAVIAVVAAGDVRRMFAGRGIAVMTGKTGSEHLRVIDHVRGRPDHVVVAVLADIRRRDVRGVLAGRVGAVMAADAVTRDVHVIEVRRYPGDRRVAIVAIISTRNVRGVFASRGIAVMTGKTGSEYLGMVHDVGR